MVLGSSFFIAALVCVAFWDDETRLVLDCYVPTMSQPFVDLKILLEGCDVYAHSGWSGFWSHVDSAGLYYNYPRLWALVGSAGIGVGELAPLSFVLLLLYVICVLAIIQLVNGWRNRLGVICLAGSPASILALERGNSDIVILFLSLIVLWFGYITCTRRQFGSFLFVLSGFSLIVALKLYPLFLVFALASLCAGQERKYTIALTLATVLGLSLVVIDLREIYSRTIQMGPASYGVRTISLYLRDAKTLPYTNSWEINREYLVRGVNILLYSVAVAFLIWRIVIHEKRIHTRVRPDESTGGMAGYLGLAALGIYCGTFLMGISFNYRLIFQVIALPFLLSVRATRPIRAAYVFLLVLGYFWSLPRGVGVFRILAILSSWALYFIYVDFLAEEFARVWRNWWRKLSGVTGRRFLVS